MSKLSRRAIAGGLVAVLAFGVAACGDDDEPTQTGDAPTTTTTEATTTTVAQDEETTTTAGDEDAAGDVVTIIGTNTGTTSYAYEDVPTEPVPAGTKLSLKNTGTEPHEMVVLRIPDTETRSIDEIAALPEDEQNAIFGENPEATTVILAATGQTDVPGIVAGDGTISDPGRYAIICTIPVGSTDDILSSDAPPTSDAPPHVALGMYAQLVVE